MKKIINIILLGLPLISASIETDFNKYNTSDISENNSIIRENIILDKIKEEEEYSNIKYKDWEEAQKKYKEKITENCGPSGCAFVVKMSLANIESNNSEGCKASDINWYSLDNNGKICAGNIPELSTGNYTEGSLVEVLDFSNPQESALMKCSGKSWTIQSNSCGTLCDAQDIHWGYGCGATIPASTVKNQTININNINNGFTGTATASCNNGAYEISNYDCEEILDYNWTMGEWSECEGNCTNGSSSRVVSCQGSDGQIYSDSRCADKVKPAETKSCTANCYFSCAEMKYAEPDSKTGIYEFKLKNGNIQNLYCDMDQDGGGWSLVAYAGKIYNTKTQTTGTSRFMPLFHSYGEYDENAITNETTFSRFDLFRKNAKPWNEFLFRKKSDRKKGLIWTVENPNMWGLGKDEFMTIYDGVNAADYTNLTPVDTTSKNLPYFHNQKNYHISYAKLALDGKDSYKKRGNVSWYTNAGHSYPGIDINFMRSQAPSLRNNSVSCVTLGSYRMGHRNIVYWESNDASTNYTSKQWFHGQPLGFDSNNCGGVAEDKEHFDFYYREYNPKDKRESSGKSCADILYKDPSAKSGSYMIEPQDDMFIRVYCDMDTDDGGWTVFQRRSKPLFDKKIDFNRNLEDYINGFGNLMINGEGWLGLENIRKISKGYGYNSELRIDLSYKYTPEDQKYIKYQNFSMAPNNTGYKIDFTTGSGKGNLVDSFSYHRNKMFSAKDRDRDIHSGNCNTDYKGGWWYGKCHSSNLNGINYEGFHTSYASGVNWSSYAPTIYDNNGNLIPDIYRKRKGHHLSKYSEMKIRDFNPKLKLQSSGKSCADIYQGDPTVEDGEYVIEYEANKFKSVYCRFEGGVSWQKISKIDFNYTKIMNGTQYAHCRRDQVDSDSFERALKGDYIVGLYGKYNGLQDNLSLTYNWMKKNKIDASWPSTQFKTTHQGHLDICASAGYNMCVYNHFYLPHFTINPYTINPATGQNYTTSDYQSRFVDLGITANIYNTSPRLDHNNDYTIVFQSGYIGKVHQISGKSGWGAHIFYTKCTDPDIYERVY